MPTLSSVAELIMGQSPPSDTYNDNGDGLPFYQGKTDFGFKYPTPRKYCSDPKKVAEAGDILISVRAPVGPTNIASEKSCIGRGLGAIRAQTIDSEFLYFNLKYIEPFVASLGTGSTFTAINKTQLATLEVNQSGFDISEQHRIAHVLTAVQTAIEQQVRMITLTRELKSALMKRLFTEGLRSEKQKKTEIGLVPESWNIKSLEGMTTDIDYGTSVKCDYYQDGSPVLRIPNVVGGSVDISDLKYGKPKKNELSKLKLTRGDLLFVRTNGVQDNAGRCSMYNNEIEECYFASYLIRVRLDTSQLIPKYLNEYVRTEVGKSFLSGRAARTADGKFNINSGTIKTVLVPVPKIVEQEEIAGQLELIEQKAKLHEQKKTRLEELFRTLLHQLMTGEVRTTDLRGFDDFTDEDDVDEKSARSAQSDSSAVQTKG